MKIYFDHGLGKVLNSEKNIQRKFGQNNAEKIKQRLAELWAANNLSLISCLPPPRCHELTGKDKGKFAVDVKQPFRIVFMPANDPIPIKEDGGIDLQRVTEIVITYVGNYH